MKLLFQLFEKVSPIFEEGGKLSFMKPLYEAMENFFFSPSSKTLRPPFSRDPLDIKRYMTMVIIGLLPCVAASIYFFGLQIIPIIIVSYMAGGAVEVAFACIRKEPIAEGFLVTGLIFPLVLPPTTPLWMVAVGCAFGVFVGKEVFGGTGRNLFNPAIVGRCFLALAYPGPMSSSWVEPGHGVTGRLLQYVTSANVEAITTATPLIHAKHGLFEDASHLVLGSISGSIGETSGLMVLCGGIFLLLTKVANWRTVVGILGSVAVFESILNGVNPEQYAPAMWHLFAGGLLFGAFFMATDPVSSPSTNEGKWIYGILIGVVTILIRNFSGYVEGVMFAILLGNIAAPIIDEMVFSVRLRMLKNE
ncbi:MAG: RnfABCDGE type electron transport complex subunit D [Planctomycetes bacterium]|nr:RnfABCDGE type electron transport complex subunit D [Planctomycetota bacterium]